MKQFPLYISVIVKLRNFRLINIFRNAGLYFSASIVQLLISLITTPIYSRYLSASEFATIAYFHAIQAFLAPISTLSFTFYYLMNYYKQTKEENERDFGELLCFLSISNLVLFAIGYVGLKLYFKIFSISFPLLPYAVIILGYLFFDTFRGFILIHLKINKLAGKYLMVALGVILVNMTFSLFFVIHMKMGAAGRMLGQMIAVAILAAVVIIVLIRRGQFKVSLSNVKRALITSIPIMLAAYAHYPINNIDKLYLERLGNNNEFGFYCIGVTIAGYVTIMVKALFDAFEPDFFKYYNTNKRKYLIYVMTFLSTVVVFILLFISFSPFIVKILTAGRYTRAYAYSNIHVFATIFAAISMVLTNMFLNLKRTNSLLINNVICGVAAVIVYKILISKFEYIGANYSKIIVSAFFALIQFIIL